MNEKYNKEELSNLILIKKIPYRQIGLIYGVSDSYIKKISKKLGIDLPTRIKKPKDWVPSNKGKRRKTYCLNCSNELFSTDRKTIYCSKFCEVTLKKNNKYQQYLDNQDLYTNKIICNKFLKCHILKEQNYECDVCNNPNQWDGKPLVLILDHIDGNAANNTRKNLRLICPNCDSQTDTYKSKNKNSARKERYLLNYKNYKIE